MLDTLFLAAACLAQGGPDVGPPAPYPFIDRLAVIREIDAKKKQPLVATTHAFSTDASKTGAAISGISKFFAGAGAAPVRFTFEAFHGPDYESEIGIVREKTKQAGALEIRIVSVPRVGFAKKAKLIASSSSGLGSMIGDGRVVAVCAVDVDGENGDELAIVRAFDDGHQSLEIRPLPSGKNQPLAAPIASDPTFGSVGSDEVVAMSRRHFGEFVPDMLVVVRRAGPVEENLEKLEMTELPKAVGDESAALIGSYSALPSPDGAVTFDMTLVNLAGFEAVFMLREAPDESRRIECYAIPFAPDLVAEDPVIVDVATGLGGESLFGVVPVRWIAPEPPPPPPPPLPNLPGPFTLLITTAEDDPLTCGITGPCPPPAEGFAAIGPLVNFTAMYNVPLKTLNVTGPQSIQIKGTIAPIANPVDGIVQTFTPTSPNTITYTVPNDNSQSTPELKKDQVVQVTLLPGVVKVWDAQRFVITGPVTGSLLDVDGSTVLLPLGFYALIRGPAGG